MGFEDRRMSQPCLMSPYPLPENHLASLLKPISAFSLPLPPCLILHHLPRGSCGKCTFLAREHPNLL